MPKLNGNQQIKVQTQRLLKVKKFLYVLSLKSRFCKQVITKPYWSLPLGKTACHFQKCFTLSNSSKRKDYKRKTKSKKWQNNETKQDSAGVNNRHAFYKIIHIADFQQNW